MYITLDQLIQIGIFLVGFATLVILMMNTK